MSAVASPVEVKARTLAAFQAPVRLALLGTGTVGTALLQRLASARVASRDGLSLVHVGNSRRQWSCSTGLPILAVAGSPAASGSRADLQAVGQALRGPGARVVIDATASDEVAALHADWLTQGIHVVTASKLGAGGTLSRWLAIREAAAASGARYGDSATVGAGLPILRALRELQAGGDGIHAISGVLSGSLAWLCQRFDGSLPFSVLVEQARRAGYTEPDPREDLSGEDVRRKLLILARCAGFRLEVDAVTVTGLSLSSLDTAMQDHLSAARGRGGRLCFVARLAEGRASVGLQTLDAADPLADGSGTDNRVAIWSDRYRHQPLVIQGPGAGAQVTAAALLDDVLRIAADGCARHTGTTDLRHARGHA